MRCGLTRRNSSRLNEWGRRCGHAGDPVPAATSGERLSADTVQPASTAEGSSFPQLYGSGKKSIDVEYANQLGFRKSIFHKGSFGDQIRIRESVEQGSRLHGSG